MGASAWEYVVPHQDDFTGALAELRRQVFAAGEYVSPSGYGLPVPASVDEFMNEVYWEFMGTCGTHSVIDVVKAVPAGDAGQGLATIRPLTDAECSELFGTTQPGRTDYEQVSKSASLYRHVTTGRDTGRAVVLWKGGKPNEIVF